MTSSEEAPSPPEEPSPDDCCGSGCATCVWDVYDQQVAQYKKEYEEYMQKFMNKNETNTIPGKIVKKKKDNHDTDSHEPLTPEEEEILAREQEKLSGRDDDDDDDDDAAESSAKQPIEPPSLTRKLQSRLRPAQSFIDHNVSIDTSSFSPSKYEGSVVVQLSTPPEKIALQDRVPDENFLTFRIKSHDFPQKVEEMSSLCEQEQEQHAVVVDPNFTSTKISFSGADEFDDKISSLSPGDTVELLRIAPLEAVESFLQYLSFEGLDKDLLREHPDFLKDKRERLGRNADSTTTRNKLSELVMCDLSEFPFVSSSMPPWLFKCSSMKRSNDRVSFSTSQQVLPLGHICSTVVDCFSWAAVQPPLLRKLLDILKNSFTNEEDERKPENRSQIAALETLATKVSLPVCHAWMRMMWMLLLMSKDDLTIACGRLYTLRNQARVFLASCTSTDVSSSSSLGDDKNTNNNSTSRSNQDVSDMMMMKRFPDELLDYEIPKSLLDYFGDCSSSSSFSSSSTSAINENMGTVEFLLRLFPSISTELFPNTILRKFDPKEKKKKVFSFARALEVLPPLKGRQFSIADFDESRDHIVVFSNFKKIRESEKIKFDKLLASKIPSALSSFGDCNLEEGEEGQFSMPPWSGMVSSKLCTTESSVSSEKIETSTTTKEKMFLRIPSLMMKMNQTAIDDNDEIITSSSSPSASFGTELHKLLKECTKYSEEILPTTVMNQRRVLLLSAGTGIAPFYFFLSQLARNLESQKYKPSFSSSSRPHHQNIHISLISGFRFAPSPRGLVLSSLVRWHRQFLMQPCNFTFDSHFALSNQAATSTDDVELPKYYFSQRVPEVSLKVLSPRQEGHISKSSSLDVFCCGPPSFFQNCREKILSSIMQTEEKIFGDIRWFSDDWSRK